ncbi:Gamma-glutamyltranspeptidase [Polynucleobacter meluiroseus]|uniref:Gamma-glutamyltranspeptidase n=1 Tax=Polynucleobacter meluiroseus TaxID=1938814 RepID=A0A240DYP3_9BURK|nr:Gamma-glutamyltranspeptidase [Polynucleobacter meluiroseus]
MQRRLDCALCNVGGAIDAAIATAAALMVVEPVSNGLSSDCFAIIWDGKELHGLNSSGVVSNSWSPDYFSAKYGVDASGQANRPMRVWDSVTIPGVLAGWEVMHSRFASLPFEELLQPAIEIAERGYFLTPVVSLK